MASLWTPGGEHRVEGGGTDRPTSPPSSPELSEDEDTASQEELRAEMERLEQELLRAPVEDVLMNHCYGLFQLAALHLNQQPANLESARLATDALALLVEGLGARLGQHADTLKEGLSSIRLAYVQIAGTTGAENGGSSQAS